MKPTAKYSQGFFLLLLWLIVIQEYAECRTMFGGSETKASSLKYREVFESLWRDTRRLTKAGENKELVDWELRNVPGGPDPLHHHGGTPNKPRTP